MNEMSWQQQFAAMKSLDDDACLRMRKPGDWYVHIHVEISTPSILTSVGGNGPTPESAVNDTWLQVSKRGTRVVLRAYRDDRRCVTWNGFMWEDVKEAK